MTTIPDPTNEGQLRYPAMGGYFDLADFFVLQTGAARLVPCRCCPSCLAPCGGGCGCEACAWRYAAELRPRKRFELDSMDAKDRRRTG